MLVGYQRELTYRRHDGSFSAFGDSDQEGSLWLTAFVLKTFAEAKALMYIDQAVIDTAAAWIVAHQRGDGSFENVGFLHHQELLGGLQGRDALTAYVAIALMEAGDSVSAASAVSYLEERLDSMDVPYTMAITAYALELSGSQLRGLAYEKLMSLAQEDDNGAPLLEWRWTDYRARGHRPAPPWEPERGHRGDGLRAAGAPGPRRTGERLPGVQVAGGPTERPGRLRLHAGHHRKPARPDRLLDKGPVGRRHDRSPGKRHLAQGGAHRA